MLKKSVFALHLQCPAGSLGHFLQESIPVTSSQYLPSGKFQLVSYQYLDFNSQLLAFSYVFLQQFRDNSTSSHGGGGTLKSVISCLAVLPAVV